MSETNLFIGGMIAGGFDASGRFLLAVSHSGRGVYDVETWKRVARDIGPAVPDGGLVTGIGPLAGIAVQVTEIDYETGVLEFRSPKGDFALRYSEGTLTISASS